MRSLLAVAVYLVAFCVVTSATSVIKTTKMVSPDPAQAINRVETSSTRSLRGADTTIDNTDDEQRIVNPVTALKDRLDFRKWSKDGKTAEDIYQEKGINFLSFKAYVTRDYGALKKHPDYKKYLNFDEFLKKKELKKIKKMNKKKNKKKNTES